VTLKGQGRGGEGRKREGRERNGKGAKRGSKEEKGSE